MSGSREVISHFPASRLSYFTDFLTRDDHSEKARVVVERQVVDSEEQRPGGRHPDGLRSRTNRERPAVADLANQATHGQPRYRQAPEQRGVRADVGIAIGRGHVIGSRADANLARDLEAQHFAGSYVDPGIRPGVG